MPFVIDKYITLMEISEGKDKWAPAKSLTENRLEDCSHCDQHRKLISTVGNIIDGARLIPKSIIMVTEDISDISIHGRISEIASYIGWDFLIFQLLNLH